MGGSPKSHSEEWRGEKGKGGNTSGGHINGLVGAFRKLSCWGPLLEYSSREGREVRKLEHSPQLPPSLGEGYSSTCSVLRGNLHSQIVNSGRPVGPSRKRSAVGAHWRTEGDPLPGIHRHWKLFDFLLVGEWPPMGMTLSSRHFPTQPVSKEPCHLLHPS